MSFIPPIQIVKSSTDCGSECSGCNNKGCPRNVILNCRKHRQLIEFKRKPKESYDRALARTIRALTGTIYYCKRTMPRCLHVTYKQLFICGLEKGWDAFHAKLPDLIQQAHKLAEEAGESHLKITTKAFVELNQAVETWNQYYQAYKSAIFNSTDPLSRAIGFGPSRIVIEYLRGVYPKTRNR